jgi:cytidylate kinase
MALITISGGPGCREEEVARLTAQALSFELVRPPAWRL